MQAATARLIAYALRLPLDLYFCGLKFVAGGGIEPPLMVVLLTRRSICGCVPAPAVFPAVSFGQLVVK